MNFRLVIANAHETLEIVESVSWETIWQYLQTRDIDHDETITITALWKETKMNVTLNSDTIAMLVIELDDIMGNADISPGTCDDLSNLLNALMAIGETGSIVIVANDDNIAEDWDDEI